jgi:hypothetical protein
MSSAANAHTQETWYHLRSYQTLAYGHAYNNHDDLTQQMTTINQLANENECRDSGL